MVKDEPGSSRLRVGDDVIDIKIVSTNEIVLRHKKLYYTVLYTVKALEERMKKIQEEDPSQQSAKELRVINDIIKVLIIYIQRDNLCKEQLLETLLIFLVLTQEVQIEMQELQKKVKELNETNQEMSKSQGVDPKEFSEIQNELKELSGRWSVLVQQSNEEIKR